MSMALKPDVINMNDEVKLLSLVREFISEFKSERALGHLNLTASIDRDLGVDSLGRVELFLRIEKAFSIQFPDRLMAEAETIQDILTAIRKSSLLPQKNIRREFAETLEQPVPDPFSSKTLIEVLLRRAEKEPHRPHIYLQDENGEEQIIRYGGLLEASLKVANGLHELGLRQGETVALMLPTCADFFYAFFGTLLAGGIPVPIYPPLRADKVEEYAVREANILNNAQIKILIAFNKVEALSKLLRVFIKSLKTVTSVEALMRSTNRVPNFLIQTEDPAMIQYTSGSTSDPKGVLLTHHNLLSNIRAFGQAIHLSSADVGVSWLPLYHDMGLIGCWFGSLYHAFPLTLMSPISFLNRPERWLWAIHYHRGTLSAGPNFAYELCVRKIEESSIQGLDLSSWRLAFNGAEAINPKTLERFIKKFEPYGLRRQALFPVYGLAETCVALTFPSLEQSGPVIDTIDRNAFELEGRAIAKESADHHALQFVSCGVPIPDHEVRIVNDNGEDVEERIVGSLYFSGPSAMQGYYRNLSATQAIYHNGWWDSGDYAYKANGEIYITGRKKDTIIKAGRNLYPQEIEEVAAQISGIRKGCVVAFGIVDQKWGTEKLVIVAETTETKSNIRNQMILDIIEKVSSVVGIPPDEVILVEPRTIPKTSSGKLQRSLCKQMFAEKQLKGKKLPVWLQMSRLYVKGLFISISRIAKKVFEYIYTGYIGILMLGFIPSIWLIIMILPAPFNIKVGKIWVKILLTLAFCRVNLQGKENLDKHSSMIFISNHASYLDSIILFSVLPDNVAFTGKKELLNWPLVGSIFRKLQYLAIDRMDFSKNLSDTQRIVETLKAGRSILIFPEGTFTYATGLRPFKLGAFKVAVDTGSSICPISLQGTRAIFRGDRIFFKAGTITVVVSDPLTPKSQEWNEVMQLHNMARSEIAKRCGELMIDLISAGPDPNHHA